jgi:hypothetical protein
MVDSKVVPFDEFYYQLKLMHLFQKHPVYTVSQTHAPGKKGEIFLKGQINNPNEKCFYLERYSRKEQFNSTNQSILSHPGLFPVIVAR